MKAKFLACTVLLPSIVMGTADITGRVELDSVVIPPGTLGRAVITVVNNGPDRVDVAGVSNFYPITTNFRTFAIFKGADTPPCVVRYVDFTLPPPQISTVVSNVLVPNGLNVGETHVCVAYIATYAESPNVQTIRFDFGPVAQDPIPTNNEVFVTVRTGAELVALPTFIDFGLGLLLSLMVAIGLLRLHKAS